MFGQHTAFDDNGCVSRDKNAAWTVTSTSYKQGQGECHVTHVSDKYLKAIHYTGKKMYCVMIRIDQLTSQLINQSVNRSINYSLTQSAS